MDYKTLSTERLILRPFEKSDAAFLFELRSNPEFMKYMHRPVMQDISEAEAFIENIQERASTGMGFQSLMVLKATNEPIGYTGIWRVDAANKTGEVGYGLHPNFTGQGYMTEALETYLQFGYQELDLIRIEAYMETNNLASKGVAERAGFELEGTMRAAVYFGGESHDLFVLSRVRSTEY